MLMRNEELLNVLLLKPNRLNGMKRRLSIYISKSEVFFGWVGRCKTLAGNQTS